LTANPLAASGLPRFFAVGPEAAARFLAPDRLGDQAVRFYGRSLSGMQKEAVVLASAGGAWRLSSDEGEYLNGLDEAPCPLAFMTTGMAASFAHAIHARLATAGIAHRGVRLVQDNYYTMEGSLPARTMVGGAKPVDLEVEIAVDRPADEMRPLVLEAVASAPVSDLIERRLTNTFRLTANGSVVSLDSAADTSRPSLPDPRSLFEDLRPAPLPTDQLVVRAGMTPLTVEATSHPGSSLAPEQHRTLHLRGVCTRRPDGVTVVDQYLYNPRGAIFRLLSDEAPDNGGGGRAPDAHTYLSAGIGFCFMTQLGRFARILRRPLNGYRIVQDTRFAGRSMDPVDTSVYLDTPEGDAFAREIVAMGERTCFLHALCRTPLSTRVEVVTRDALHVG
jgi:uncharacterized OsmC-like protein